MARKKKQEKHTDGGELDLSKMVSPFEGKQLAMPPTVEERMSSFEERLSLMENADFEPTYDDGPLRLEMVQVLTKRLPELWDRYVAWMNKNDMAQGRWKPDFVHFITWLKEYYG